MATKPFASSADLGVKEQTLEVLADGVYALTAEGDPNLGAIEGEDFLVCFEALATPVAARRWLAKLRGHTEGDIVAWLPKQEIVFAGDLVESQAALYTGDAFHFDWAAGTLDRIKALGATQLIGGRGKIARGREEVDAAIEQTRDFLLTM